MISAGARCLDLELWMGVRGGGKVSWRSYFRVLTLIVYEIGGS